MQNKEKRNKKTIPPKVAFVNSVKIPQVVNAQNVKQQLLA